MAFEILSFGFAWWLGLYLLARDSHKALLRRTGLGLVAYALALAVDLVHGYALSPAPADTLLRVHWALILLPALFWSGALVLVLPDDLPLRPRLDRAWRYGLAPAVALAALLVAGTGVVSLDTTGSPRLGMGYL